MDILSKLDRECAGKSFRKIRMGKGAFSAYQSVIANRNKDLPQEKVGLVVYAYEWENKRAFVERDNTLNAEQVAYE